MNDPLLNVSPRRPMIELPKDLAAFIDRAIARSMDPPRTRTGRASCDGKAGRRRAGVPSAFPALFGRSPLDTR